MKRIPPVVLLFLFAVSAWSADDGGHYAVKGAGTASCGQFLEARRQRTPQYFLFGGWMEGFLSAANLYEPGTFDIVAWQNTDLLATFVAKVCETGPDMPFHLAVARTMNNLLPGKLDRRSAVVGFDGGEGRAVAIYADVVLRLKSALREQGYFDGDDGADDSPALRDALRAFQVDRQLPPTGLPDQVTLVYLFMRPAGGVGNGGR
jgi:hypothetical protein